MSRNIKQHALATLRAVPKEDQASFVITMALGMLGLSDQQEQTVEAAIPDAQALVDLVNQNAGVINQVVALINKAMPHVNAIEPAAQIVADAVSKQAQAQDPNEES